MGRKDYPKDMTRTASSLLLFDFDCRSSMRTLKTHFEQVPVEIVKKIAELQRMKRLELTVRALNHHTTLLLPSKTGAK